MFSRTFGRIPSVLAVTSQKQILTGTRCCWCVGQVTGHRETSSHSRSFYTRSRGQGQTYQRWSRSHLTTILAGVGISMTTYMLWNQARRVYAEEPDKETSDKEPAAGRTPEDQTTDDKTTDKTSEPVDWSRVPEIPGHVPYLLIGGGVASLEAFKAIKTKDVNAKVLMIGDERYEPYFRPPLSKQFWLDEDRDNYKSFNYTNSRGNKSTVFMNVGLYMEPKKLPYSDRGGLALLSGRKVAQLDPVTKTVVLDDGQTITYDKCLIATGGRPRNDKVLETAGVGVRERTILFRNLDDVLRLGDMIQKDEAIAIVGGGFLGSELAVGMAYRGRDTGMKVHQVFPDKGNMSKVLPEFLSVYTSKKIENEGVSIIPEVHIKSAVFEDGKVKLGLSNGTYLSVDHVLVAVGLEPNTDLAISAGLELDDKYGGFRVNTELQARSDVWAAGDCACFYDEKLGRRRVEHFDHASITGRLAGFNMAGEANPYTHQSMFWSNVGPDISYEAVGLVDSSLQTYAVFRKHEEPSSQATSKPTETDEKSKNKSKSSDTISEEQTTKHTSGDDEYSHGVIFYLRGGVIVGMVLWNLDGYSGEPTRMDIARQVIEAGKHNVNLTEVAKLFNVYAK